MARGHAVPRSRGRGHRRPDERPQPASQTQPERGDRGARAYVPGVGCAGCSPPVGATVEADGRITGQRDRAVARRDDESARPPREGRPRETAPGSGRPSRRAGRVDQGGLEEVGGNGKGAGRLREPDRSGAEQAREAAAELTPATAHGRVRAARGGGVEEVVELRAWLRRSTPPSTSVRSI